MSHPTPGYSCYRHPDREAYISCQRCERLICPECMREASVGFQCPSCVTEGAKSVRVPRTSAGGVISATAGRVSLFLIGINAAVFVLIQLGGGYSSQVYQQGAQVGYLIADGDLWRLITGEFLHASALHLLSNLIVLYLFGPFLEQALGTTRFIAAYVTSAVVASVFVYTLADPTVVTVGASGAAFGLFGMALMVLLKAKQDVRTLVALLAINAFVSVTVPRISWEAHLGGFVAGIVLGAAFAYAPRPTRTAVQIGAFAALWICAVIAVTLRTTQLL
jgi:membrane associated rhomboid family serine protease